MQIVCGHLNKTAQVTRGDLSDTRLMERIETFRIKMLFFMSIGCATEYYQAFFYEGRRISISLSPSCVVSRESVLIWEMCQFKFWNLRVCHTTNEWWESDPLYFAYRVETLQLKCVVSACMGRCVNKTRLVLHLLNPRHQKTCPSSWIIIALLQRVAKEDNGCGGGGTSSWGKCTWTTI